VTDAELFESCQPLIESNSTVPRSTPATGGVLGLYRSRTATVPATAISLSCRRN